MKTLNVVITGASSDLGRPLSLALAQNGHRLFLHYHRNADHLYQIKSDSVFLHQADLTHDNECKTLIEKSIDHMGTIDVLINMIGPYISNDILTTTPKEWRTSIELNLNVTFGVTSFTLPHIQQSKGHIVNFCYDGVEAIRSWQKATAYGAAKAGVAVLTKSLAHALGPFGARANAICPGYIDFGMFKDSGEDLLRSIPLGRFLEPREVIEFIIWLIERSPNSITGALLPIGGGFEHKP